MAEQRKNVLEQKLAYKNNEFLDSEDGRPLRILAEYLEPLRTLREASFSCPLVWLQRPRSENGMNHRKV